MILILGGWGGVYFTDVTRPFQNFKRHNLLITSNAEYILFCPTATVKSDHIWIGYCSTRSCTF